ncbi:MAG: hypothetical protein KUG79_13615 [Pseudomonadales bacterium]|nr:hypothetical protein [Pseudomonadales bacterium]
MKNNLIECFLLINLFLLMTGCSTAPSKEEVADFQKEFDDYLSKIVIGGSVLDFPLPNNGWVFYVDFWSNADRSGQRKCDKKSIQLVNSRLPNEVIVRFWSQVNTKYFQESKRLNVDKDFVDLRQYRAVISSCKRINMHVGDGYSLRGHLEIEFIDMAITEVFSSGVRENNESF